MLNSATPRRSGTADHLYGIAAECALKAVLVGLGEIPPNAAPASKSGYKVHIDQLWIQYGGTISGKGHAALALPPSTPFAQWRAEHRYEDDGLFTETRVEGHRNAALIVFQVLESARIAGLVP